MRLIGCATIRARMAARLSGKKYSLLPSALNAKHTITNTNHQYQRQGRGPDKKKCRAAQALGEEALDINRTLNAQVDVLALDLTSQPSPILNQAHRELCTAEVLLNVARMYRDLEMFEQARGAVKEVLVLRCRRFGSESASVADCHGQVAHICNSQSVAIERSMSQKSSCFWPGSRVRVEGLQNYPQYNGLEGVMLKEVRNSRVCIRLDQDNKDLRLTLQNVRTLVATADERKKMYTQTMYMRRSPARRSPSSSK